MAGTVERTLALKLIADVGDIKKPLAQADSGLKKMAKSTAAWGKAFAGALIIGGIERFTASLDENIKAFREEQDIVRNFNSTIRNLGLDVKEAGYALDGMSAKALDLGFDDGETVKGMDQFIKQTGSIKDSTELMNLAMDIARSRNISLTDAMKIAQGVYNGSGKALKQYGIEGKKGMEAVEEARKKERGKARAWARNHPFQVTLGKIQDTVTDIIGQFSEGNFKAALDGIGSLGSQIDELIFGKQFNDTRGRSFRRGGLVERMGRLAKDMADGIAETFASIDWGKTLTDTLNSALGALAKSIDNGTLGNLAVVGTALAGAVFAVGLFITAAKSMFDLPGWAAKAIVKTAASALGLSFRAAMWVGGKFLTAAKLMFDGAGWGAKAIVKLAASAMGKTFAAGMFVAELFANGAVRLMAKIGLSKKVLESARLAGVALGLKILAGIAVGVTGVALVKAVADALFDRLTNSGATNWTNRGPRPLPQDPLGDIFRWITGGHAAGTAGAPRGWSWVGENGPELMRFRGGEQVKSNRASMAAMGGNHYTINVNVPPTADKAAIGQAVIEVIKAAEKRNGKAWRS